MALRATIHVDFNDIQKDGSLPALLHYASRAVRRGDTVRLVDAEGNACDGRVERVLGEIAHIRLDRSTWVAAGQAGSIPIRSTGWSVRRHLVFDLDRNTAQLDEAPMTESELTEALGAAARERGSGTASATVPFK